MRTLSPVILALLLAPAAWAQLDDDLGDPLAEPTRRRGTQVSVDAPPFVARGEAFELKVTFVVPEGYHIYGPVADGVENMPPTVVRPEPAKGITWKPAQFPKVHKGPTYDEVLEVKMTKYLKRVVVTIPGTVAADASYGDVLLQVKASWGTCNDMSCMETRTIDRNPLVLKARTRVVLTKPKVALPATLERGARFEVTATFDVPEGHHIYGSDAKDAIATRVALKPVDGITWGPVSYPATKDGQYRGAVTVTIVGTVAKDAAPGARTIVAALSWGTCGEETCVEFAENHPVTLTTLVE